MNYKLKTKIFILFHFILYSVFIFWSCGKKEQIQKTLEIPRVKEKTTSVSIPAAKEKKVVAKYRYRGEVYRDPFIPLDDKKIISSALETSGEGITPALGSLTLKGIIIDKTQKIALFSSPTGRYILRNEKLYDNRNRRVRHLTGKVIDTNTVKIVTEDNFVKTYKLKEKNINQ